MDNQQIPMQMCSVHKEMESLIPSRVASDSMQSLQFMKDLTMLAVSNIAFGRGLCPSDCFKNKTFEEFKDMELKIFDENSQNQRVQFFLVSLNSAFEAISKKFLHYLVLCMYKDNDQDHDNLLESYVFEYTYTPEGDRMLNISSINKDVTLYKQGIEEHTKNVILTILALSQSSSPLPESTFITINTYYNSSAPSHYQPSKFLARDEYRNEIDGMLINMKTYGLVQTPFHQLCTKYYDPEVEPSMPSDEHSEHTSIRCVCNLSFTGAETIVCKYCGNEQHSICYGLWHGQTLRAGHCCMDCAIKHDRTPTDVTMLDYPPIYRQRLSSVRRGLSSCVRLVTLGLGSVTGASLIETVRVAEDDVHYFFKALMTIDVLIMKEHVGNSAPERSLLSAVWNIGVSALPAAINQVFSTHEEIDLPASLRESQDTQLIQSNTLQDLMNDSEQMPQIASDILRVSKKPDPISTSRPKPDETLRLYVEAISSQEQDEDDDLPLSGSHNPIKTLYRTAKPIEKDTQSDVIVEQKGSTMSQANLYTKNNTPHHDFTVGQKESTESEKNTKNSTSQHPFTAGQKRSIKPKANESTKKSRPQYDFTVRQNESNPQAIKKTTPSTNSQANQTIRKDTRQHDFTANQKGYTKSQANESTKNSTPLHEFTAGQSGATKPQANQTINMGTLPYNFMSGTTKSRDTPQHSFVAQKNVTKPQYGQFNKKSVLELPTTAPRKFFKSKR